MYNQAGAGRLDGLPSLVFSLSKRGVIVHQATAVMSTNKWIICTAFLFLAMGGYMEMLDRSQADPMEMDAPQFSREIKSMRSAANPLPEEEGVFFSPYLNKRYLGCAIGLVGGFRLLQVDAIADRLVQGKWAMDTLVAHAYPDKKEEIIETLLLVVRYLLSDSLCQSILKIKKQQPQVFWQNDKGQSVQRNVVYWPMEQVVLVLSRCVIAQFFAKIRGETLNIKSYDLSLPSFDLQLVGGVLCCLATIWYFGRGAEYPKLQGGRYTQAYVYMESLDHYFSYFGFLRNVGNPPASLSDAFYCLARSAFFLFIRGDTWIGCGQTLLCSASLLGSSSSNGNKWYSIPILLVAFFWYPLTKYTMGVRR